MRTYGTVRPRFWTGETGRTLRGDPEAQVVALYLMTSPHASMLGAYYLPITYLAHETGLSVKAATAALARVCDTGFAEYEAEAEFVWVPNLAREQVGPSLRPKDKRRKGILAALRSIERHPFAARFMERYGQPYGLATKAIPPAGALKGLPGEEEGALKGLPGEEEGASKGLCPAPAPAPAPDPVHDPDPADESVAAGGESPDAVVAVYEEVRDGTDWPKCRRLTPGRVSAARVCLGEFGTAGIRDALQRARACAFFTDPAVRNASLQHASWRPDIDWFLQPDKLARILEGRYDDEGAVAREGDTPARRARCAAELRCDPDQLVYDDESDGYLLPSGDAP